MTAPNLHHQNVQQEYRSLAENYEAKWARYLEETHRRAMEILHPEKSPRILNLACGTGYLENLVLQSGAPRLMTGIDLTFEMLRLARDKFRGRDGIYFQNARASLLPFKESSFDLVSCVNSFHFFVNPVEVLRECWRVLKPSGRLVIVDWCRDFFFCKACDWYLKRANRSHHSCYPFRLMDQMLKTYGFSPRASFKFRAGWLWGMMAFECVKMKQAK